MGDGSKCPSLFSEALRSELKEIIREVFREEMKNRGINAAEERLLDTKQVAKILGVSESYLEHNAHRLPFTRRLGPKLMRFSYLALLEFIDGKNSLDRLAYVISKLDTMKGSELRRARKTLGKTQRELAEALGLNKNTVARAERDEIPIQRTTELAVTYLLRMETNRKRGRKV